MGSVFNSQSVKHKCTGNALHLMLLRKMHGSTRKGKSKVKTGCLTCKARRIKCDEARPQCQRCMRSGFDCEGYALNPIRRTSALVTLHARTMSSIVRSPDIQLSDNPKERQYFHLYCQSTAAILSGYFPCEFWSRLVPQIGYDSAPIRHAIAAVSALLQSLENTSRSPLLIDVWNQKDDQYHFALWQYTKAISALRHLLSTKGSHYRIALIASIIFTCFETLQGDLVSASKHIFGAFSLATEASGYRKSSHRSMRIRHTIDNELISMLEGLEVQSKLPLFYASNQPTQLAESLSVRISPLRHLKIPIIPRHFKTVNEAKVSLDTVFNYINRLEFQISTVVGKKDNTSDDHKTLLHQWEVAFSPIIQMAQARVIFPQSLPIYAKDYAPHFIMASNHALGSIIVATNAGHCSEMLYDSLTTLFERIVDYSKKVIDAICSNTMPKFVFEVGLLPPLHVTALKCRLPKLRREAIALLRKWPAQEGVWEGYGCAAACEWVMGIEEGENLDGFSEPKHTDMRVDPIPEWNRVKLSSMVCWLHERRISAQCTSVLPVVRGSHRVYEQTFTW